MFNYIWINFNEKFKFLWILVYGKNLTEFCQYLAKISTKNDSDFLTVLQHWGEGIDRNER